MLKDLENEWSFPHLSVLPPFLVIPRNIMVALEAPTHNPAVWFDPGLEP